MTREEIMELNIEELEKRKAEIAIETDEANAEQLETLNAELDAIEARRQKLSQTAQEKKLKLERNHTQ